MVYVACKVDEAYVSAEALGGGIKQDPQIVLSNELAVLQASHPNLMLGNAQGSDAWECTSLCHRMCRRVCRRVCHRIPP